MLGGPLQKLQDELGRVQTEIELMAVVAPTSYVLNELRVRAEQIEVELQQMRQSRAAV